MNNKPIYTADVLDSVIDDIFVFFFLLDRVRLMDMDLDEVNTLCFYMEDLFKRDHG